jgi:hypothetical protein
VSIVVDPGSKPAEVAVAAAGELGQIDTSSIETLTRLKDERDRLEGLIERASANREGVPEPVYERVVRDYRDRIGALDAEGKPLRDQARQELTRIQGIHARLRKALEAALLDRQEIEFRHGIGEVADEDYEGQHSVADGVVTDCQGRYDEAEDIRQRFQALLPDEPEPAPAPPTPPAPPVEEAPPPVPATELSDAVDPDFDPSATMATSDPAFQPAADEPVDSGGLRTMAVPVGRLEAEAEGGQTFVLGASATIGRTPDNDIPVNARAVSRHHARIFVTADGYTIKDLESGNGTLVNEERIDEVVLKDGDRICFGTEYFVFHVND